MLPIIVFGYFLNWIGKIYLEGANGLGLEAQIGLEILGNLTDQTLEGQLADQQLSRFLVATNLTQGNSTRSIAMGLLDATGRWG